VKQKHDEILKQPRWIIDGWGSHDLLVARFASADTIIFVDHQLYIHYWWAIKRQLLCLFRPRPDGPEGCPMLPMTWPLLKMIWNIHTQARPGLTQLIERYRGEKPVYHIRSPRELRRFVQQYC